MKTVTELQQELDLLEREHAEATKLVNSINMLSKNMEAMTRANVLGNASASELLQAQSKWEEATKAVQRQALLNQSIRDQRQALDYARAAEKRAFIDKIGSDFAATRAAYIEQSRQLLATFKEMMRLHNLSISMRSTPFMFDGDFRLDLPALRRDADSELFSVGMMVRSGDL
jgi:hypothetical protein